MLSYIFLFRLEKFASNVLQRLPRRHKLRRRQFTYNCAYGKGLYALYVALSSWKNPQQTTACSSDPLARLTEVRQHIQTTGSKTMTRLSMRALLLHFRCENCTEMRMNFPSKTWAYIYENSFRNPISDLDEKTASQAIRSESHEKILWEPLK